MEQKRNNMRAWKQALRKTTKEVNTNGMIVTPKRCKRTNRVITTGQLEIFRAFNEGDKELSIQERHKLPDLDPC